MFEKRNDKMTREFNCKKNFDKVKDFIRIL